MHKDIIHLLGFVEAEIVAYGAIHGNGIYRQCKAITFARLVILLWSIQSNDIAITLEGIFGSAKLA